MNRSLLAKRYAKALLAYAIEVGEADLLYPLLRDMGRVLRPAEAVEVLCNPTLSEQRRSQIVVALAGEDTPESLRRWVDLVFSHNREALLGDMARAYMMLYRKHKGITLVRVTSAVALDASTLQKIEEVVRQKRGGVIEMETEIDQGLIGGFVLRIDGMVMDASAKRAIERIRQQFISRNKTIV